MSTDLEQNGEGVSGGSPSSQQQEFRKDIGKDTLVMQDIFQVTGYSHKPFYKLSNQEATELGAKEQKKLIFFKGVLIRGNSVTTRKAIVDMDWIKRKKDLWPGKPITILHPEFKGKVAMNGRDDMDIIQDLLKYQEPFAVGRIMKVDSNFTDPNLMDFYGYLDNPGLVKGVESGEVKLPRFGSPYIWALGKIDETNFDNYGHFIVRDHYPVHWSFVPKPAMGPSVEVKAMCTGEELECLSKIQAFGMDDSEYKQEKCPCTIIKENFAEYQQIDNSFYLADPITQLSIMTDQQDNTQEQKNAKDFMNKGNKGGSMPETSNPDGEGNSPNPGEHVDRDKASENDNKDKDDNQSSPEEKSKLETLIEDERAKAEKSVSKKYEKTIAEKDGIISKLQKENAELKFKEKEDIINETYPDGLFGKKEDDIKKAQETRAFYIKLAKEKNLTIEELSTILGRPEVKTLNVTMTGGNHRGQANTATDGDSWGVNKDQVRDYMLGKTTADPDSTSKSRVTKNPDGQAVDKDAVKSFFGIK